MEVVLIATIGYATLSVIPSLSNVQSNLERGITGPAAAAGRRAGDSFGDAAGREAGDSFSGRFKAGLKGLAGPIAALGAGAGAIDFLKGSLEEAREAAEVSRRTAAALEATGFAANVTADEIDALASSLSQKVAVDDEAIASAQNLLLTFKSIANTDTRRVFDEATQATLDLSAAMGTDLNSAALQVGKSLNDPVKGMAALARSGIQFTQAQKDQAKAMVEAGDLVGAQGIVLAELSAQFDGAAAAAADGGDRVSVAFGNLKEQVGTGLLPAFEGAANALTSDIIPALSNAGSAAAAAYDGFRELPGVVRNAALAFVALRAAAAVGLASLATGAVAAMASAFVGLRIRALLATDAFVAQRATNNLLTASFAGVRAGATGATVALAGLGRALVPVAVITAGITLFTQLASAQESVAQEEAETKARVDELTDSLNKQTGALTETTEATVLRALADSGALAAAKELGLSLETVTAAALGNRDAAAELAPKLDILVKKNAELSDSESRLNDARATVLTSINAESEAIGLARERFDLLAEAQGETIDSGQAAAGQMRDYARETNQAEGAMRRLIAAEKARKDALLKDRQDALALEIQIRNARKQARDGEGEGINIRTKVGGENQGALLDLAGQFNNSTPEVRNADGAYERIRQTFIALAEDMGAGQNQAKALADELLRVPKSAPIEFQSKGFPKQMREIRELTAALAVFQEAVQRRFDPAAPYPELGGAGPERGYNPTPAPSGRPRRGGPTFDAGSGGLGGGSGPTVYQYNGPVTYTDDEQGRRRARYMERRGNDDGVRRR